MMKESAQIALNYPRSHAGELGVDPARINQHQTATHDTIVTLNEANWLRVPVGKLHTDRYVPLHPSLIELHRIWR